MITKYIVIKHPKYEHETFIMFPEYIPHKDFYQDYDVHGEIVSAGFVLLSGGEFICHGESVGLDVRSRPAEDAVLANEMFGRY